MKTKTYFAFRIDVWDAAGPIDATPQCAHDSSAPTRRANDGPGLDTATESPAAMPTTPIPRHFSIRKPVLPTGAPAMENLYSATETVRRPGRRERRLRRPRGGCDD
jgi:hypothetical protein